LTTRSEFGKRSIISRFVKFYGKDRIEAVTGDREFNNEKLLNYLEKEGIHYALRLKKTNRIIDKNSNRVRIEAIGNRSLSIADSL